MPTLVDREGAVSLRIGGHAHEMWDSYSIDSDLLVAADAWQFSLGLPAGEMPASVRAGVPVEVRIGNDLVLTGRIDSVARTSTRPARSLSLSGRDGAAVLVDCSAPIFSAREVTLDAVIATVARPLGIRRVRIESDSSGGTQEKVSIDPGVTAWDAIQQAAEAEGLWPWFEPDGTLVIGGPNYQAPPVATLVERLDGNGGNVLDLTMEESIAERYSEVTVLAQAHGTGDSDGKNSVMARVRDAEMPTHRPLVVVEGDVQSKAEARVLARKKLMDGRLAGMSLTAAVRGHRTTAGELWAPGQRVHVQSQSLGVDGIFFLMGRTFRGGARAERISELRLKEDGVWTIDAYRKTKKSRKKKKLEAVVVDVG